MAMSNRVIRLIDAVQWIFIVVLMVVCSVVFIGNRQLVKQKEINKEQTYVKIYESQEIESLRKENKELRDSLMVETEKNKLIKQKTSRR